VLLNGDISQIPQLIQHAQKTMRVIKQNITWAIVYNAVCIPLAFFGLLTAWQAGLGMAISSIIVVANALRLTQFSTPALASDASLKAK
jgi:Cu2+-exporting ATPase